MVQVLIILIVATVLVTDDLPGLPLVEQMRASAVAAWMLGALIVIGLTLHVFLTWCGRRVDRSGRWQYVRRAERALWASRVLILVVHIAGAIGLGWLDVVRSALGGDLVLIDEALVVLGPIAALTVGWWSFAGIDRRLHEAALLRTLDEGLSPPALPSRMVYVLEHVRHDLLLLLIPIGGILAWTETFDWASRRFIADPGTFLERGGGFLLASVHLGGVLIMVILMPLVLRLIWRTAPLGPGPLRDQLMALCQAQRVRCRDILVWRTQSGLLNGAVIGLIPQLRFILLTESLLEQLGEKQVEAVMAHEVAHARWRHLPWLMLALVGTVGSAWALAAWLLEVVMDLDASSDRLVSVSLLVALSVATGVGLIVFAFISRRFEEQADAFAAQHLSGLSRNGPMSGELAITPEAAGAMSSALGHVAALNCIPLQRFMWRHGSIRARQRRLVRLVGRPARRLPIDRKVVWLKLLALGAVALLIVLGAVRPDVLPM